jgi:hypothetical protein
MYYWKFSKLLTMAKKTKQNLDNDLSNRAVNPTLQDIVDSVALLTPGSNVLPTSDPGEAGALFVTASSGFNFGAVSGSGFAVFCVSQG